MRKSERSRGGDRLEILDLRENGGGDHSESGSSMTRELHPCVSDLQRISFRPRLRCACSGVLSDELFLCVCIGGSALGS
jgi:hypothetical protein